jgi:hypothetical protein
MNTSEDIELRGGPADGQIQTPPQPPSEFNSMAIGYQNGKATYRRTHQDPTTGRWIFQHDKDA